MNYTEQIKLVLKRRHNTMMELWILSHSQDKPHDDRPSPTNPTEN